MPFQNKTFLFHVLKHGNNFKTLKKVNFNVTVQTPTQINYCTNSSKDP